MKYFTREWTEGKYSDRKSEEVISAYHRKKRKLKEKLSQSVRELVFKTNIHDGFVRKIIVDKKRRKLCLKLLCGDLQVGYFNLDLIYSDVDMKRLNTRVLTQRAKDQKTEALYDEVDIQNGYYVHSILFWPEEELDVFFKGLKLKRTPRKCRTVVKSRTSRYQEIKN